MLLAEASSAICVQRFDDSRNSAIHTTYRISLRSSSLREPRYPLLRVVLVRCSGQADCTIYFSYFGLVLGLVKGPTHCGGSPMKVVRQSESLETPKRPQVPDSQLSLPSRPNSLVHGVGIDRFNDPSAGSPTETLLRLLLPLGGRV